ncbi:DNA primase [Butyricimonas virosa]|mgnify:FL=1|uniref:DNA primase n=1 Tax=Butyricimonas virosa TaxID=544645 RepID=UPI00242BA74E|nr:DNA primase [Butyricimonas virosa]
MAIAQEIIDRVLGAADIVGIIGEHVKLSKRSGQYWGVCPFHNEKTSSFTVSPTKGIYKCFGCGKGGNVINFLQEHEKMSFPEAVRYLGKRYNIEIPEKELTPEELQREKKREAQQVALRAATLLFTRNRFSKEAKEYLVKRGFSPEDSIIERYQIGYAMAHRATSEALKKQGFSDEMLFDISIEGKSERGSYYDYFQDRIVFPYFSITGSIIGFQARYRQPKDNEPKYRNSRETDLFKKGNIIFGLYQARNAIIKEDKVFWTEGQFDVLSWVKSGIENTVGGSGTAMTTNHLKQLIRFTRNITLVFDGDKAGQAATIKSIENLLPEGANVRCIPLPNGEDPDSFARKLSPDKLKQYIKNTEVDFLSYLIDVYKETLDDPISSEETLTKLLKLLAHVEKAPLREAYLKKLSATFNIEFKTLTEQLKELTRMIPAREEEMQTGFYGVEEAIELIQNTGEPCILTGEFSTFTRYYGDTPVIYYKGIPGADQVQNLSRSIEFFEYYEPEKLNFDVNHESSSLLLLKEIFKAKSTINIRIPGEDTIGFAQYYVNMYSHSLPNSTDTEKAIMIDRCAETISFASDTVRAIMATSWQKSFGLTANQYKEILKPHLEKRKAKSALITQRIDIDDSILNYDPEALPDYVEQNEEYSRVYRRHGFYPLINKDGDPVCYMFRNGQSGHVQVADFYMIPLLHIYDKDSEYNKRVIKINRLYSKQPIYIEVKSKSLASLQSFEEILLNEEALNFENGEVKHFKRIRQAMSYNYTKCVELKTFGQQQEGFYAFANAIFHEVDNEYRIDYTNDLGVVTHDDINYYSPAFSKIYANLRTDNDKYEQLRKFTYRDIPVDKQCSFKEWASLMNEVYKINDNGKWAIIYAIMCAFRSDIHVIDRLFTALFFIGPTMSGKTQIAISIRSLYVDRDAPSFNLNSGTDAAFFTLMEGFRDVPQVLEEYNNKDISKDKFQGLKAITYDGDGKQKRKGVSDKDIDTSKVNSPVIILGQETPQRDDNALMNRVVLCEVPKRNEEYTTREKEIFDKLKEHEKIGLCNILFEVLKLRPIIRQHFKGHLRDIDKNLTKAIVAGSNASGDMVRIIKTVSLFLTTCKLLEKFAPHLELPFTYDEFFNIAISKVKTQLEMISHTDKLAGFFKAVEVMINNNTIKEGRDFAISQPGKLTLKLSGNEKEVRQLSPASMKVLFLRISNVFTMYNQSSFRDEDTTQSTIEQNLRSNPAYIGIVSSRKFSWNIVNEVPKGDLSNGKESSEMIRIVERKEQTTSCLALNYEIFKQYFDIDLERNAPDETIPEPGTQTELKEMLPTSDEKPF